MSRKRVLAVALILAAAGACKRPTDQVTDTFNPEQALRRRENLPVEVVAQLDSGSAAFRAKDVEAALAHYQRVTEQAPDVAAGWFGVYMAQSALGNKDAAAAALEKVQTEEPGATLIHKTTTDTTP